MNQNTVDRSRRHLIVGKGACGKKLATVSAEQGVEVDLREAAELRSVDPAPSGRWWVSLRDGERRLYAGVIVTTRDCSFVAPEVTGVAEATPHLAAGLLPTGYKNIYFFQPPEGQRAPQLLDRGAALLVELVRIQPLLDYPAGALLQRMGMRAPMPWWNHALLGRSEIRVSRWVVERLPAMQLTLMRGDPRTARIRAFAGLLQAQANERKTKYHV